MVVGMENPPARQVWLTRRAPSKRRPRITGILGGTQRWESFRRSAKLRQRGELYSDLRSCAIRFCEQLAQCGQVDNLWKPRPIGAAGSLRFWRLAAHTPDSRELT